MKAVVSVTSSRAGQAREEAQALRMFKQFAKSPAMLTEDMFTEIERGLSTGADGVTRRCGLAMMIKSGRELVDLAQGKRESAVLLAMGAECAKHSAERLRELAGIMDSAHARLLLALASREDMEEVLAEGKAEVVADGLANDGAGVSHG